MPPELVDSAGVPLKCFCPAGRYVAIGCRPEIISGKDIFFLGEKYPDRNPLAHVPGAVRSRRLPEKRRTGLGGVRPVAPSTAQATA